MFVFISFIQNQTSPWNQQTVSLRCTSDANGISVSQTIMLMDPGLPHFRWLPVQDERLLDFNFYIQHVMDTRTIHAMPQDVCSAYKRPTRTRPYYCKAFNE